ncbi:unnamed protein product [Bursaphelenchus okinawaensis]|uniref:Ig-like domain-containing protein n=1 Tax=Bursaphelenchus okinawaensis TaxID=465554 RepID=A0A811L4P4_9BILA|nr:unnamed protein product [Bursaphelenchus okinawaensis]CAG9119651.1 unnamed protein product [Bursaphelenchus okinawaensis]
MVRWYRNNEPIKPGRSYETGHSAGEAWLKIASVSQEHAAEFKCEASNPAGKASTVANLVIKPTSGKIGLVPASATGTIVSEGPSSAQSKTTQAAKAPQFVQKLTSINARAGENVKLVAVIDGQPLPNITWNFNGKALTGAHKATQEGNKVILELTRVSAQQAGTYACVLKNASGTAQSEAKLNLQSR